MKFQTLFGLYFIWKNRTHQNRKLNYPVFATSASYLIFLYLGPLMPFSPFPCDILAQGLIGLIEYSYHQDIPSFLKAQLKRTPGLSVLVSDQFQDG
jgi:hypothetical protein